MCADQTRVNTYKFLKFFAYIRIVFGLYTFASYGTKLKINLLTHNVQRIIACIWFIFYIISATRSNRAEFTSGLKIKSSLIVHVLPAFTLTMLTVSTGLTLLFTHVFAEQRLRLIKEVMNMDNVANPQSFRISPKAFKLMLTVAAIQCFNIIFWLLLIGPIDYYRSVTIYEIIVTLLPRSVSTIFLMDYFTANAILLHQFIEINESLERLQKKSKQMKQYPDDERLFQQELINVSDRHRKLNKIAKASNKIYALQLLVNIALFYAVLLAKTYTSIYAVLSVIETGIKIKVVFVNVVQLVINSVTLLLLVEISSRVCQEVKY